MKLLWLSVGMVLASSPMMTPVVMAQVPTAAITEVPSSQVRISRSAVPIPKITSQPEAPQPATLDDAESAFAGTSTPSVSPISTSATAKPEAINIQDVRGLIAACQQVIEGEAGKPYNPIAYGQCFGYVRGVVESYLIQRKISGKGNICLPRNGTWLQYIKVFLRWADANPAMEQKLAWHGLVNSLSTAFPCRGPGTSNLPAKPGELPTHNRTR